MTDARSPSNTSSPSYGTSWSLLAVVALHVAALAFAIPYARTSPMVWFACTGVYYAQVSLLGIWLGIGSWPIYWRVVLCGGLLACLTRAFIVAGSPNPTALVWWGVILMLAVAGAFIPMRRMGGKIVHPAPPDLPLSALGLASRDGVKVLLSLAGMILTTQFLAPLDSLMCISVRFAGLSLFATLLILIGCQGAVWRALLALPALSLLWGYLDALRQGGPVIEHPLEVMSAYALLTAITLLAIRRAGYRFVMAPVGLDSPALRRIDAGDLEGARRALAILVEKQPESPATWYAQSRLALEDGDPEQALEAIQDVLAVMPRAVFALVTRHTIYVEVGDLEGAESDATQLMELAPAGIPMATLFNARGVTRMKRNNGAGAMADLNEALRLDRRLAMALRNRSALYARACRFEKALEDAEAALVLEPDNAMGLNNRAWSLAMATDRVRDPARALADAQRAMELIGEHPNRLVVVSTLAAALGAVGDFPAAIERIHEALEGESDDADRDRFLEQLAAFEAGKPYTAKPAYFLP